MVVEPRVKDYICTTAHPVGCAENVKNQIKYVKAQPKVEGPKKVLVIGASTGYGLASRIAVAFGYDADTKQSQSAAIALRFTSTMAKRTYKKPIKNRSSCLKAPSFCALQSTALAELWTKAKSFRLHSV